MGGWFVGLLVCGGGRGGKGGRAGSVVMLAVVVVVGLRLTDVELAGGVACDAGQAVPRNEGLGLGWEGGALTPDFRSRLAS